MTVGVLREESDGQVAIERLSTTLIGEEKVLGQGIGFVPSIGGVFVRTCTLFRARQRLLGKVGGNGTRQFFVNVHSHGILSKLVCVNQTAGKLVVGVGWQTVVDKKLCLRVERLGAALPHPIALRTRRRGSQTGRPE